MIMNNLIRSQQATLYDINVMNLGVKGKFAACRLHRETDKLNRSLPQHAHE